ncbi:hypothetical protein [Kitasatospora sp. NPDC101183]|uniref:hypothetical protein n=1 Tax=Kitasatospora sp. NPDC101183 TaxID=3364100 RepID=UPI00382C3017
MAVAVGGRGHGAELDGAVGPVGGRGGCAAVQVDVVDVPREDAAVVGDVPAGADA